MQDRDLRRIERKLDLILDTLADMADATANESVLKLLSATVRQKTAQLRAAVEAAGDE